MFKVKLKYVEVDYNSMVIGQSVCYICNDRTMYIYLYGPQWWRLVFHMPWSTVGGSRSPSDLVSLWVTRAGPVASPAVTRNGIQSVSCS